MEQLKRLPERKRSEGWGLNLDLPGSQQPWGRGRSGIQNETADGYQGEEGRACCAGVLSNPPQTKADRVCEGWWVLRVEDGGTLPVKGGGGSKVWGEAQPLTHLLAHPECAF